MQLAQFAPCSGTQQLWTHVPPHLSPPHTQRFTPKRCLQSPPGMVLPGVSPGLVHHHHCRGGAAGRQGSLGTALSLGWPCRAQGEKQPLHQYRSDLAQHRAGNCLILAKISHKISPLCIFLPFFLVQKAGRMFLRGFPTCRKKSWAKPVFNWKTLGARQEWAGWVLKVLI